MTKRSQNTTVLPGLRSNHQLIKSKLNCSLTGALVKMINVRSEGFQCQFKDLSTILRRETAHLVK